MSATAARSSNAAAPVPNGWNAQSAVGRKRVALGRAARVCVAAYLYGSIPVVYLLGRQRNLDLKESGSGNVGAHNLWKAGGSGRAVAGWIFDASKGVVPIVLCRRFIRSRELSGLAGVFGVAGQCWPVFLCFNGGRGISAFVGASFAIDRRGWIFSIMPMIGGSLWRIAPRILQRRADAGSLKATRSKAVPFGCFLGVLIFPLVSTRRPGPEGGCSAAPALLAAVIFLRRLTAPLPDDPMEGPDIRREALMYRLLFDRNTNR